MFNSFFMGGFECADHVNRSGNRVNLLQETEHDVRVFEDYRLLLDAGISTAREGICWSSVETAPYEYDFSEAGDRINAANVLGIQQIWDLCHFGYPDGLYPTHPHFCDRFVAFCEAFAIFYKVRSFRPLLVVPINEISFLSWHSGEVRGTVPFAVNCGFDIEYHLCKAALAGMEVLRKILPDCRIMFVEPIIRVHPGSSDADMAELHELNETQFQAMDIIAGRMCPELGGNETNLDVLGVNYYWDCQWVHKGSPLSWPEPAIIDADDHVSASNAEHLPRRAGLSTLLAVVQARYGKPLFIAETGHFGSGRAQWLEEVTSECIKARNAGVNLLGPCIYPVIDRPDWDHLSRYHNSGIWDLDALKNRVASADYFAALRGCAARMNRRYNKSFSSYGAVQDEYRTSSQCSNAKRAH